jgi:hypothetical protein
MKTTNETLNIKNLSTLDKKLTTQQNEIRELNKAKNVTIKDILNTILNGIKELNSLDEYTTYSKKAKAQIVAIKLDKEIENPLTRKIVKSVVIYLNSKSNLDFNTLSVSKFNQGMGLINKGTITKFKSNSDLEKSLKDLELEKLRTKVAKLKLFA